MINGLSLVTAPASEPITLSALKLALQVDSSTDDALLNDLITAGREACEKYIGGALITQTWDLSLDDLPVAGRNSEWWDGVRDGAITDYINSGYGLHVSIPLHPLQSITSVTVFDEVDVGVVWAATNYFVDITRKPGRLCLRSGISWPVATRQTNGIVVRFVAGYASAADVPEPINRGIVEWCRKMYMGCMDGEAFSASHRLWRPYRLVEI